MLNFAYNLWANFVIFTKLDSQHKKRDRNPPLSFALIFCVFILSPQAYRALLCLFPLGRSILCAGIICIISEFS